MTAARPARFDSVGDGDLVRSMLAGDQSAFAAIYDRYADRLFDFCLGMLKDRDGAADCVQDVFVTAATRLGQLHDADRLKSWLYAIARNEALARIRARRREQSSESVPETPSTEPGPEAMAARSELADLITEACGGLSDRDQVVLELVYRHGLDGVELADALGVTHHNAHTLMGRLRENVERSLGALLVCRGTRSGVNECPELAGLLANWDGQFTVLMRKRVARHIDDCPVCEADRRLKVNPVALLGGAPLFVSAPAGLRQPTLTLVAHLTPLPAVPPGAHRGGDSELDGVGAGANGGAAVVSSWWPPPITESTDVEDLVVAPPVSGTGWVAWPSAWMGPATFAAGDGAPLTPGPGPAASWAEPVARTHHSHPRLPLVHTDGAPAHPLSGHLRLILLLALLLVGVVGGLLLGAPLVYRVWPAAITVPGTSGTPAPLITPPLSTPRSETAPSMPAPPSSTTNTVAPNIGTPASVPTASLPTGALNPTPWRPSAPAGNAPPMAPVTTAPSRAVTSPHPSTTVPPAPVPVAPVIPGLGDPPSRTPAEQIPTTAAGAAPHGVVIPSPAAAAPPGTHPPGGVRSTGSPAPGTITQLPRNRSNSSNAVTCPRIIGCPSP